MKVFTFVCFAIALLFSQSTLAYNQGSGVGVTKTTKSSKNNTQLKIKSSQQAAQLAKSRFGGKVLKVSKKGSAGFRVKLVKKDGHVISVYVDARTGQIRGN